MNVESFFVYSSSIGLEVDNPQENFLLQVKPTTSSSRPTFSVYIAKYPLNMIFSPPKGCKHNFIIY
ncbi:hypothetical protein KFK09_016287 [Dendrobium nobile]|uniref:Uncharacterized protein n=1 Tax=Dendrobium nobile TaxID=94219 RepID=A0A8T3AXV3_DENNO|nr:hypothetical protein KFK09_016287 [Dendrobium nobile]